MIESMYGRSGDEFEEDLQALQHARDKMLDATRDDGKEASLK